MTRSGAPSSVLPQCKFFEQMRILHDKTANKPTESNISHAAMDVSVVSESSSQGRKCGVIHPPPPRHWPVGLKMHTIDFKIKIMQLKDYMRCLTKINNIF